MILFINAIVLYHAILRFDIFKLVNLFLFAIKKCKLWRYLWADIQLSNNQ